MYLKGLPHILITCSLVDDAWRMVNSDLSIYSKGLFLMRPLPACQVFGEVQKQLTHQPDLGKVSRATDVPLMCGVRVLMTLSAPRQLTKK